MKLAVYGICKNEMKFMEKWLENVNDADYICLLDTGSEDGTYEYLLKLQESNPSKYVIKQEIINPWRFDVARNKSMELIPDDADILVCVDIDELFTQKNWVDIIKDNWTLGKTNRVRYNYAWSHNDVGECQDIFTYDKIHTREMHWKYPVHEVLWPNDDKYVENEVVIKDVVFLEHFADKTKSRPYFDLLKLACEEFPDDPHERMLLAREYLITKDYDNALDNYLYTLKMPAIDKPQYKEVLLESLGRCADIYKIKKNFDESIWYCQEWIKEDKSYREPYFIMAELYNLMQMYSLAEAICNAGFEYGTRKYSWVERASTWLGWGYDVLSVAQANLNKISDALKNVDLALAHDPDNARLLKNKVNILKAVVEETENKLNNQNSLK